MIHIIAIVGPSGAGKTAISKAMARAGIPYVVSYTTRPMRDGETEGVEHHFITEAQAESLFASIRETPFMFNQMVPAFTEINGYCYFIKASQLQEHPVQTYVVDEVGLLDLEHWNDEFKDLNIIPVYIYRDKAEIAKYTDAERMARDKERITLPEDTYTIRVINDSPSLDQLNLWAENFAFALKTVIKSTGIKPCTLHTSEDRMLDIVNKLNNVQHHGTADSERHTR